MITLPQKAVAALAQGLVLALCLVGLWPADAVADDASQDRQPVQVSASWYADNSCRLKVGSQHDIGETSIDADMDDAGARTLIHCDAESGRRLTLMTRGEGLTIGERQPLANGEDIDTAIDSAFAWVTRIGPATERFVPDEISARRYLVDGHLMIRETPGVDTVDSAPHIDKRAFAEVVGQLEPLLQRPPEPPAESESESTSEPASEPDALDGAVGKGSMDYSTMENESQTDELRTGMTARRGASNDPGTTH